MKRDKWKWLKVLWITIDEIEARLAVLEYMMLEIKNARPKRKKTGTK